VAHGPLTVIGGVERHCHYVLDFLHDEGFQVDVFEPRPEGVSPFVRRYLRQLVSYRTGAELLDRREQYEFIFTISFAGGWLRGSNVWNISYGSVMSYYRHIKSAPHYNWKWHVGMGLTILLDKLSRSGKRCLTISRQVSDELAKDYGASSIALPCGIDTTHFSPRDGAEMRQSLGIAPQAFVGAFVGRWDPVHKGLDTLTRVMRERDDIHWLIATGGKPTLDGVKHLTIVPNIGYEEMPRFFSAADFSIQLSRYESFGFSFVESLACGVPAISTPVGIVSEAYADDALRPLIMPLQASGQEKLGAAVHKAVEALRDRNYRRELGARCREVAERDFSLERWRERMRTVLGIRR